MNGEEFDVQRYYNIWPKAQLISDKAKTHTWVFWL